jgi:hypothetical protein
MPSPMLLLVLVVGLFLAGYAWIALPPVVRHVATGTALIGASLFATATVAATTQSEPEPATSRPFVLYLDGR